MPPAQLNGSGAGHKVQLQRKMLAGGGEPILVTFRNCLCEEKRSNLNLGNGEGPSPNSGFPWSSGVIESD